MDVLYFYFWESALLKLEIRLTVGKNSGKIFFFFIIPTILTAQAKPLNPLPLSWMSGTLPAELYESLIICHLTMMWTQLA